MAKPTGFLEFKRELPNDRSPSERIKDWNEFHDHLPDEKLKFQGARCMDCGIPFCHTGTLIKGAASGCPINNLIPEWNDLVYKGLWQQALERLLRTNNFPEFTGRVCPAPCEGSCTLGINENPVTIKSIEQAIIDKGFENNWITANPPLIRTGKKVAIVGSGPSGLACADQLNHSGHLVTVFERSDRIGGLLIYGIPNMKLDKETVKRRIELMTATGITFMTNTDIGNNYPVEKLFNDFDATVLCCGATQPRNLLIEGRELNGVHFAMEFLHGNMKNLLDMNSGFDKNHDSSPMPLISAEGKDVIVIGGGDTGTDCVGTALRQNCHSLIQLEILSQLPDKRQDGNPWPEWPKIYKLDYGQEEYQAVHGDDPRQYSVTAKRLVGDDNGNLKEIHTINVVWIQGTNGRYIPQEIPGTEKIYPTQLVLIAMGFLGPEEKILRQMGIEMNDNSSPIAEYGKFNTNRPGIFAAGDMRRGQSLVVWAINEGRGAARECDRFLMGNTSLP